MGWNSLAYRVFPLGSENRTTLALAEPHDGSRGLPGLWLEVLWYFPIVTGGIVAKLLHNLQALLLSPFNADRPLKV